MKRVGECEAQEATWVERQPVTSVEVSADGADGESSHGHSVRSSGGGS